MPLAIPPAAKFPDLARTLTYASDADMHDIAATRRGLILAPFLVALPAALLSDLAYAVDPRQTQVTLPGEMQWKPWSAGGAEGAMESAAVFGAIDKPGPYAILVRWHPGYMSAPHTYVTDRLCFVISGLRCRDGVRHENQPAGHLPTKKGKQNSTRRRSGGWVGAAR